MIRLVIDCEFNEFKGELISMALVPLWENTAYFYEVLECKNPGAWVAVNVMPVLHRLPISYNEFQQRLCFYLNQFSEVMIIADWPDDIRYFCESLITGPGMAIKTPRIVFDLRRDIEYTSAIPHNALEDARAIAKYLRDIEV